MNHLTFLFHEFEHEYDSNSSSSEVVQFSQNSDSAKSCFYCDTYLNLDYAQHESLVYSLIEPDFISDRILDREKQLVSNVVQRKKSRSPPSHNS